MSKITFNETDFPVIIPDYGAIYAWCCTCGSRHVWTFEVLRGKSEEDDKIFINCVRDENAEKLRRFYEKHKKGKHKRGKE